MLVTAAFTTSAKAPHWNFVEGSYLSVDVDDSDIEPDGFALSGSYLLSENVFVAAGYSSVSDDIFGTEVDWNQGNIGLGYRYGISNTADVFAAVSYEYMEFEANSESVDDSGYGLHVGVRNMLTDNFELVVKVGYVDIGNDSATAYNISGYYHFNNQFAVGLGYSVGEDADTITASARLSF